MSSTITEKTLQQFHKVTDPQEAQAQIAISPAVMVHEARFALQQLKQNLNDSQLLVEVIEPLARAIGWVEAQAYVFTAGSVGAQVPVGNGRQGRS